MHSSHLAWSIHGCFTSKPDHHATALLSQADMGHVRGSGRAGYVALARGQGG